MFQKNIKIYYLQALHMINQDLISIFNWQKISIYFFLILALLTGIIFIRAYQHNNDSLIIDFVASQDLSAVKVMIQENLMNLGFNEAQEAVTYIDKIIHKQSSKLKIIRKQEKIIGFLYYCELSNSVWQIDIIVIHKDHRKKGYATQMLNYCIDDMRKSGAQKILIHAIPTNLAARSLYENKFQFIFLQYLHNERYIQYYRLLEPQNQLSH